jgi:hypothetical protein
MQAYTATLPSTRANAPWRLRAVTVAETVPARFVARVHSVFLRASNLELESGRLIAVMDAALPAQPGAVRLVLPPGLELSALLAPGEPAACRAGVLRVGAALHIDLRGAEPWRVRLPLFTWAPGREPAWRAAWACWRQTPSHQGSVALARGLAVAQTALAARDAGALLVAAESLLGVGPGLTPSGDDALLGLLVALGCMAPAEPSVDAMRRTLAAWTRASAGRTTTIARAYLLHGADGHVGVPWIALVEALASGDPVRAEDATREALRLGASSGADGVQGLLAGLAALHPGRERLGLGAWTPLSPGS